MAIHLDKKQSDLEKRLKVLRQQVYGRSEVRNGKLNREVAGDKSHFTFQHPTSHILPPTSSYQTDILYLHQDLLKISLLASFALGAQIILFFLLKNQILNINFF